MSNIVFPEFRKALAQQLVDVEADEWRAALLMTNSTVLDDADAEFLDDITALDEFDGGGYARQVLSGLAVSIDAPTLEVRIDANDVDFGVLSTGLRPIKGMLLMIWGGSDATSRPAVWLDQSVVPGPYFPYTPVGSNVAIKFAAAGFAKL